MEENKIEHPYASLMEGLIKMAFQVQITKPDDKQFLNPIAFGSGFMIQYRGHLFFVTADHNLHGNDHKLNERTGVDNVVSIFNNISDKENFSTGATPLDGFYYMEKIDVLDPENSFELIDVAVCMLNKKRYFKHPFLTENCTVDGKLVVKAGEQKFNFVERLLAEPRTEDQYLIYGKIKYDLNGMALRNEATLKEDLKYITINGDYLLFNTPYTIARDEDWAGLSGSAVVNQRGECVGVLCSVNTGSKSIFVKPISKVKMLMDLMIIQEAQLKEQKQE